ncbi:hypothetical protein P7K49_018755, partial [Saguinus oedipus]
KGEQESGGLTRLLAVNSLGNGTKRDNKGTKRRNHTGADGGADCVKNYDGTQAGNVSNKDVMADRLHLGGACVHEGSLTAATPT